MATDYDEYLFISQPNATSVHDVVRPYTNRSDIVGLLMNNLPYGGKHGANEQHELLLDYVMTGNRTDRTDRLKYLAHVPVADYTTVHNAFGLGNQSSTFVSEDILFFKHFKVPHRGVFQSAPKNTYMEPSLRDQYRDLVIASLAEQKEKYERARNGTAEPSVL